MSVNATINGAAHGFHFTLSKFTGINQAAVVSKNAQINKLHTASTAPNH